MQQRSETIRQRIIDAADRLFYHQGYDNTSFSDIAEAVNISRGNFYYHFKTKDDILNAVIEHRIETIKSWLSTWDKTYPNAKDRLKKFVTILVENQRDIEKYGCPLGTLCAELGKLKHTLRLNAAALLMLFRSWLSDQILLLGHKNNADTLAMHLLARSQGAASVAHAFHDNAFLQQEVDHLLSWIDQL